MKIKVINTTTNEPLTSCKVQMQVRGKDAGFISATSDETGTISLDEKYKGQHIAGVNSNSWTKVEEGATLMLTMEEIKAKEM